MEINEQKRNDNWKISAGDSDISWFVLQFSAYALVNESLCLYTWVLIQGQMENWNLNWSTDTLVVVLLTLSLPKWLSSKMVHAFGETVTNTDTIIVKLWGWEEKPCVNGENGDSGRLSAKLLMYCQNTDLLMRDYQLEKWLKCDNIQD